MVTIQSFILNNPGVLLLFVVWELTWKALALWRAARNGSRVWYVAILVVNSLGILPILYLALTAKKK